MIKNQSVRTKSFSSASRCAWRRRRRPDPPSPIRSTPGQHFIDARQPRRRKPLVSGFQPAAPFLDIAACDATPPRHCCPQDLTPKAARALTGGASGAMAKKGDFGSILREAGKKALGTFAAACRDRRRRLTQHGMPSTQQHLGAVLWRRRSRFSFRARARGRFQPPPPPTQRATLPGGGLPGLFAMIIQVR